MRRAILIHPQHDLVTGIGDEHLAILQRTEVRSEDRPTDYPDLSEAFGVVVADDFLQCFPETTIEVGALGNDVGQ